MNVDVKLDQLDLLFREKQYLIQVLRLWRHAEDNLDKEVYDQIRSFTFHVGFLDKGKREENIYALNMGKAAPYCGLNYHNAVRLNSGDLQEIPLIERPQIPDSMKIKTREVY
jgi:hypothetical protein